ncbi:tyrosine-type recombinase/integrase [Brachybacterium kimchii]|uniref:Site-specific integrase n=1 Tax=Brachybacterium kimchii TaxID=2942909 RepID=A0ABY4N4F1_9MICO|nr:site-specific integrase [Brachybacterium kimchii]UQN29444.1 site-specific integrase [Brachybacterium kimchii]
MRDTANPKVKQYTDARTGKPRYLVRYRKPDGRQSMKRGFPTKRDAEAWLTDAEGAKRRGEFVEVSAGRIHLAELADPWLRAKRTRVKPSTLDGIEGAWRIHVRPRFGRTSVARILPSEVEAWIADLVDAGKSPTVVRRAHAVLAQMLDTAVRDRRIAVNPARGITLPRARSSAHRYLSHLEVRSVAERAGEHRTLVYLLAYGGLRWGEAAALRVMDVQGARVRVDRAVVPTRNGWKVGTPKTHERRTLYLPGFVARMVADETEGRDPMALLFPAPRGEYLRTPGRVRRGRRLWWQAALEDAGVDYLRIHDLRHTAASLAVQSGAHVKAVQRMLGHRSAAMTLDRYADLWDSDLDAVAGSLDAARTAALAAHGLNTGDGEDAGASEGSGVVVPLHG